MNSRRKGQRGELELAQELIKLGMFARRSQQYSGVAGDADLIVRGLELHVECKRVARARIDAYAEQARIDAKGKPWGVFLRLDRSPSWLVIQPIAQWAQDSNIAQAAIAAQRSLTHGIPEDETFVL